MNWWVDAIGRSATLTRAFTAEQIAAYNRLAGDDAPAGLVPEPLIAGLFSKLLGVDLPGPGTNYLKQQLEFSSLAAVGEEMRAQVQITAVRPDKRLVNLITTCLGADDRVVCRGQALVLAGGVPPAGPSRAT